MYVAPSGLRTVRPDAVFITAGEEMTLCPLDINEKVGPVVIDDSDDESSQALVMQKLLSIKKSTKKLKFKCARLKWWNQLPKRATGID